MNDLVSRLRKPHRIAGPETRQQLCEAADRIEKLEGECANLRKIIRHGRCRDCQHFSAWPGIDGDGVCTYPGNRPTSRFGVIAGIWNHVANHDVCLEWVRKPSP